MRTKYIHSLRLNQDSSIKEDWRYLMINTRGVFGTQSNIYNLQSCSQYFDNF